MTKSPSLVAAVCGRLTTAPWSASASVSAESHGPVHRAAGGAPITQRPAAFVEAHVPGCGAVKVAYERHGTGEPMVLLHGLGHHRGAWDAVVPLLCGDHEIITLDLPGFGQSPDLDPSVPRDLPTATGWLSAIFAELGAERPHVVGHSLGGLIALHLGQTGLARSVTALAPAGFWTGAERRYAYARLIAARHCARLLPPSALTRLIDTAAGRTAMTGTLHGRLGPCPPETAVATLMSLRDAAGFTATLRAGRAPGLFQGDIPDIPVTIGWGTRDSLLPPRQATRVKAMIPSARLVPLGGCGHVPMNDAPALVARTILATTRCSSPAPAAAPFHNDGTLLPAGPAPAQEHRRKANFGSREGAFSGRGALRPSRCPDAPTS